MGLQMFVLSYIYFMLYYDYLFCWWNCSTFGHNVPNLFWALFSFWHHEIFQALLEFSPSQPWNQSFFQGALVPFIGERCLETRLCVLHQCTHIISVCSYTSTAVLIIKTLGTRNLTQAFLLFLGIPSKKAVWWLQTRPALYGVPVPLSD